MILINKLYKLKINKPKHFKVKNCVNFKYLEEKCLAYNKDINKNMDGSKLRDKLDLARLKAKNNINSKEKKQLKEKGLAKS